MVNPTVMLVMMAWSAPPSMPAVTAQIVKTPTAATRPMTAANRPPARVAQIPPTPEGLLPPRPGLGAPQPVPPLPPADPFGAPQLPPNGPQLTPPADPGYRHPVPNSPMGMGPQPAGPAFGPAPEVANIGYNPACQNCYGCPCDDDDDDCCLKGPPHPCDMIPHYAYYPKYHGHYYFRPYNYNTIFQQQQWAAAAGLDPRNPYSNKIFDCVFAGYEQLYRVDTAPVGSALPAGNNLPQLEGLLEN